MANTVTTTTLLDGSRLLVVKIDILGDGTGEETDKVIVDASTFTPAFTNSAICNLHATLAGFTARLEWDATTDVPALSVPDYEVNYSRDEMVAYACINNNAGTGKTGDLLMTTAGLGAGDHGTILIRLLKKG